MVESQGLLEWYAVCTVVLFVKMVAIGIYQGYYRIGRGAFQTPEDARWVGRQALDEELPEVRRGTKAWRNDVENIPMFLILGFVYMLLGAPATLGAWLFGIFTIARILHTLFFLAALQPWRTLAYAVGLGATLVLAAGVLVQVV